MVAKLTVIFFIILCLIVGIFLTLLPWTSFGGIVDWSDNYFLNLFSQIPGLSFLKPAVSSGWFRGAVTGLGVLNLFLAFWELANFNKSVKMLEEDETSVSTKRIEMSEQ